MRKLITFAVIMSCAVLAAPTLSHASYTKTKHPIVLVHGVTGFKHHRWLDQLLPQRSLEP